jgi:CBS domain-containing protein
MKKPFYARIVAPLTLHAETAEELMTPNPLSLYRDATIHEAATFLVNREISAAPVIDEAGRPVGVLSRADIVRYEGERVEHAVPVSEFEEHGELLLSSGERLKSGFQVEVAEQTLVRDIMTPVIISVVPTTPVLEVVAKLVAMKLHRLFVVDEAGVLVGVISTFDILRNLRTDTHSVPGGETLNPPGETVGPDHPTNDILALSFVVVEEVGHVYDDQTLFGVNGSGSDDPGPGSPASGVGAPHRCALVVAGSDQRGPCHR